MRGTNDANLVASWLAEISRRRRPRARRRARRTAASTIARVRRRARHHGSTTAAAPSRRSGDGPSAAPWPLRAALAVPRTKVGTSFSEVLAAYVQYDTYFLSLKQKSHTVGPCHVACATHARQRIFRAATFVPVVAAAQCLVARARPRSVRGRPHRARCAATEAARKTPARRRRRRWARSCFPKIALRARRRPRRAPTARRPPRLRSTRAAGCAACARARRRRRGRCTTRTSRTATASPAGSEARFEACSCGTTRRRTSGAISSGSSSSRC